MSEKHTPGPWHTSLLYYSDIPENARVVICAAPKSIQHAHTKVGEAAFSPERSDYYVGNRYEAEANARLMAAAPILLQELRGANAQMQMAADCIEAGRYDEALLHVCSMSRKRRAAIAAATGETP